MQEKPKKGTWIVKLEKLLKCDACSAHFCQLVEMLKHKNEFHNIAKPDMNCKSDFNKHACNVCGTTFKSISELGLHEKNVHKSDKKHSCQICGNVFANKSSLIEHVKSAHEGLKLKSKCDICEEEFTNF